jgi:hypothetical protein
MIEVHKLGMSCVLAATLVAGGCIAPHPPQTSAAETRTGVPSAVPARFNKASLVGCWTWLQEDGANWLCFDEIGHYVIVVSYDGEGGDSVGKYILTPDGQLFFNKVDEIIRTRHLTVVRKNTSEISLHGMSENNVSILMKLKKDNKNGFYKEISRTYF